MSSAAHAVVVSLDDFSGAQQMLVVNSASPIATQIDNNGGVANPGILGGFRDVRLQYFSGTPQSSATINFLNDGMFSHNQDGNVVSQTLLTWNGDNGSDQGGAPLNANLSAFNGLEITLVSADAGIQWLFTIVDGDSTHTATVDTVCVGASCSPPNPGPEVLFLPFSAFGDVGNLNLGQVTSISLLANNTKVAAFDTLVDSINLVGDDVRVPEPATLALLGSGLLGLGWMRRRRP